MALRAPRPCIAALLIVLATAPAAAPAAPARKGAAAGKTSPAPTIFQATLGDAAGSAPEISTDELKRMLVSGKAAIFDARPFAEYAMGHIPGARNVAAKPGVPMSDYVSDVAEIGRALNGDKSAAVVLYCNGPFCGKSKRLAEELVLAGYRNVRRYQLGIPFWRALGEPTQIESEGLKRVLADDRTAFVIDAREPAAFRAGALPGARNIPRSGVLPGKDVGVVKEAKNDGRLPMEDHNTRVIVLGATGEDARYVAEALAHEAFHNVSFFAGSYVDAVAAVK